MGTEPIQGPLVGTIQAPLAVTEQVKALLEQAFPDASELAVIDRGGGDHLEVRVSAPSLAGVSLIDQHRRVNAALAAPLADGSIHELRIKTRGTTA